jgi:hypothetical protein
LDKKFYRHIVNTSHVIRTHVFKRNTFVPFNLFG